MKRGGVFTETDSRPSTGPGVLAKLETGNCELSLPSSNPAVQCIWTRAKHRNGLERPHFWEPLAAQKNRGVAPARQTGKSSVCEVFCPRPVKRKRRKGGNIC